MQIYKWWPYLAQYSSLPCSEFLPIRNHPYPKFEANFVLAGSHLSYFVLCSIFISTEWISCLIDLALGNFQSSYVMTSFSPPCFLTNCENIRIEILFSGRSIKRKSSLLWSSQPWLEFLNHFMLVIIYYCQKKINCLTFCNITNWLEGDIQPGYP